MSDTPLPFHTREQLASALGIQREVTATQRATIADQAQRIAILEARLARYSDIDTATLRAEILAWIFRDQREIVCQFNDTDSITIESACEAAGDTPSRRVAAWVIGILFSDFIYSERALRGVLRQRCSVCSDDVCDGHGCGEGTTELQIPVELQRMIADARPRLKSTPTPASSVSVSDPAAVAVYLAGLGVVASCEVSRA